MKKIIVVDYSLNYAETLKNFLAASENVECMAFTYPYAVLRQITNDRNVDVVIAEYQMPDMNGFEFADKVLKLNPDIRMIVMNSKGIEFLRKRRKENKVCGKVELIAKNDIDFFARLVQD
jgi:DNA-binding NarL/FixJ family response regulator